MDAYTLGAFAVAVAGIILLVWVVLRAVTNLAVIAAVKKDESRQDTHTLDPFSQQQQQMPFPFAGFPPPGAPIPPPSPPPPVPTPPEEEATQTWPQRDEDG